MHRKTSSPVLGIAVLVLLLGAHGRAESPGNRWAAAPEDVARWRQFKFGLFIHWGPVSLTGGEISWCRNGMGGPPNNDADCKNIPGLVYDQLYRSFYPAQFDARDWVRIAHDAGMRYLVFTTKHHDGFCMFDSQLTDYTIMHSPFRRDVVKELADACHEGDVALGLYYSPPDWHYGQGGEPKPYQEYFHGQMRELCNHYGKVDVLWFDMAGGTEWGAEKLLPLIRQWQPHVLLDDRLGGAPGDFSTREGGIGQIELKRPWESCITLQHYQFSWNPNSRVMAAKEVIHTLIRIVSSGGNFLLNLGPMPTGQFDPRQVQILEEVGRWLKVNGESVYGTEGGPFIPSMWVTTTQKGRKLYVHVLDWPRDLIRLPVVDQAILSASRLGGEPVTFKQAADGVELSVPVEKRDSQDTVVVLELAGPAAGLPARRIQLGTLSENKHYSASGVHRNEPGLGADKAFDGDVSTRWAAPEDAETCWLAVDLGAEMTFDRIYVDEHARRVLRYELQVKEADAWRTFHRGEKLGEHQFIGFPPVKGSQVRLFMSRFVAPPTIWEFQILAPVTAK